MKGIFKLFFSDTDGNARNRCRIFLRAQSPRVKVQSVTPMQHLPPQNLLVMRTQRLPIR
jgi:hypothetical protein